VTLGTFISGHNTTKVNRYMFNFVTSKLQVYRTLLISSLDYLRHVFQVLSPREILMHFYLLERLELSLLVKLLRVLMLLLEYNVPQLLPNWHTLLI
jgi:hypothetical protein